MNYNNSNQFKRIYNRFLSYFFISADFIKKGVPFHEVMKTKFPYYFTDNKKPLSLTIEMGNICNISCVYCNIPKLHDKREFMTDSVFQKLIENLKDLNVNRIRISGGEPTMHPNFSDYVTEIRKYTSYLSIVTNLQWNDSNIFDTLMKVPFDLIEVSMDAGGKKVYETSRIGAKYSLFQSNLKTLSILKKELKAKSIINMRLMVRPSTVLMVDEEKARWKAYCDTIMPQFVCKIPESDYCDDVFFPIQVEAHSIPKCTLPFKDCIIKHNGSVPYCQVTGNAIERKKIIAGNIVSDSIYSIWNHEIKKLRDSHRKRVFDLYFTDYCRGCSGR